MVDELAPDVDVSGQVALVGCGGGDWPATALLMARGLGAWPRPGTETPSA